MTGNRKKAKIFILALKIKNTYMITHCNGSSGYLVTDAAYSEGGYEVRTTRVMSGAEKGITENLVEMINGL